MMKYKKSTLKQLMIYFLLILFFLSFIFVFHPKNLYLLSFFLGIFIILTIFLLGYEKSRFLYRKNMGLNIIIGTLSFQIIYYLLGLYFGFVRNGYSLALLGIIKNLIPALCMIIFTEFLRYCLNIKSQKNKILLTLSVFTFVLLDVVLQIHLYNLSIGSDIVRLVSSVVIPSIAKNILLTYLSVHYGYGVNMIYRMILELPIYFVPIYPDIDLYIDAVLMTCFPSLVFYLTYKSISKRMGEKDKIRRNRFLSSSAKISYGVIIVVLFVIVSLTSGIFHYLAITIGSGSMSPNIQKGDIVIVKKINSQEIKDLKEGDVLVFRYHDKIVVHRVIEIEKGESDYTFQTKGDHNNSKDSWIITERDLVGKVQFKIPFLGYPTVKLNEVLSGG